MSTGENMKLDCNNFSYVASWVGKGKRLGAKIKREGKVREKASRIGAFG